MDGSSLVWFGLVGLDICFVFVRRMVWYGIVSYNSNNRGWGDILSFVSLEVERMWEVYGRSHIRKGGDF